MSSLFSFVCVYVFRWLAMSLLSYFVDSLCRCLGVSLCRDVADS